MDKFKKELERLINKYSVENQCDMPDLLVAEMVVNFIQGIGGPIKKTLDWHGCDSVCHPRHNKANSADPKSGAAQLNRYTSWRDTANVEKVRKQNETASEIITFVP